MHNPSERIPLAGDIKGREGAVAGARWTTTAHRMLMGVEGEGSMRRIATWVALLIGAAACTEADPDRFDLQCSGSTPLSGARTFDWMERYSFDLKRRLVKMPDEVASITSLSNKEIVVEKGTKFSAIKAFRYTFDRQALTWRLVWIDDPDDDPRGGSCERLPYTPF